MPPNLEVITIKAAADTDNDVLVMDYDPKTAVPKYLIVAALTESDPATTPAGQLQPDCGNVKLMRSDVASQSVDLIGGWMRSGKLNWSGCVPIVEPWRVRGSLFHARNGCNGQLDLLISDTPLPNGSTGPPTTPVFPYGKLRVVTATGVAAAQTVALQPDQGYIWDVLVAWGYHDDTSSRNLYWSFTDGTNVTRGGTVGMAAPGYLPINGQLIGTYAQPIGNQLTLSNRVYAVFNSDAALNAGKKLYVTALVREYASD